MQSNNKYNDNDESLSQATLVDYMITWIMGD